MINFQCLGNLFIYLISIIGFFLYLRISYKIGYSIGHADGRVFEKVKRILSIKLRNINNEKEPK